MIAMERIQNNFQNFNDDLFWFEENSEYGMFIPLVLVARESVWTQEQADQILGSLVLALKVKWAFFGVMLGLGLICIGLTVKCI